MSDKKLIDSSNFPAFDPYNFQIKNQTYGNTGGNCMVGTTEFRLPIAGASVWVNCSNEAVSVYSTDTIWNGDNSDTWGKEDDYLLFRADLDDKIPYAAKPWLKMIKEALAYTIEKETAYFNGTFSLPLDWLPSAIKDNVSTEYLDWLKKQDKNIIIGKDSVIVADDEYAGNVIREDKPFDEYYMPQWEERPDDDGFMFRPTKHLPKNHCRLGQCLPEIPSGFFHKLSVLLWRCILAFGKHSNCPCIYCKGCIQMGLSSVEDTLVMARVYHHFSSSLMWSLLR